MSAFLCSKKHIQLIAFNYVEIMKTGNVLPIANELFKENLDSVNFRYSEVTKFKKWTSLVPNLNVLPLVELYKAILCLDYQSCEHDGWYESKAQTLLNNLIAVIVPKILKEFNLTTEDEIASLDAYTKAPWSR
jgi:hypothetical protein